MVQYIYFVKCPNCEDEHFDFFYEAKEFALGCLGNKPIITQTEVCRNDFGECTDSSDLGTIWSWEDEANIVDDDAGVNVFTKGDFAEYDPDNDPEFNAIDNSVAFEPDISEVSAIDSVPDNFKKPMTENMSMEDEIRDLAKEMYDLGVECASYEEFANFMRDNNDIPTEELYSIYKDALESFARKSIPEGMTIEQLVEEMEENEDTVECTWCNELFDKSECRKEVDLGYLCPRCEAAIKSRGETLTFRENNYWDFLDEDVSLTETAGSDNIVELSYDALTTTLYGPKRDVDDWDEEEYTDSFTYKVSKDEVANAIWENFITEEDAIDVPGGLDTLEDNAAWEKFLETHFDILFEKYYAQLLAHFEDDAREAFEDQNSWDAVRTNREATKADAAYDAWRDEQLFEI